MCAAGGNLISNHGSAIEELYYILCRQPEQKLFRLVVIAISSVVVLVHDWGNRLLVWFCRGNSSGAEYC